MPRAQQLRPLPLNWTTALLRPSNLVSDCTGCIYITGAGTSGTIARRTAHLLATCSMRAFYINAAEALHGPSAAVTAGDLIIILSKAGESAELNQFAAIAKERGAKIDRLDKGPRLTPGGSATWSYAPTLIRLAKAMACSPLAVRWPWARSVMLSTLMVIRKRAFDLATLAQTHPSGATAKLVMK